GRRVHLQQGLRPRQARPGQPRRQEPRRCPARLQQEPFPQQCRRRRVWRRRPALHGPEHPRHGRRDQGVAARARRDGQAAQGRR
ncbi:hypothetical protein BN1708_020700, partial [Verticillium longisporum]